LQFLIVSGLSGAGKSRVAEMLEDMGFYCVDNMPAALMPRFAELCLATKGRYENVALVTDVRAGKTFDEFFKALDDIASLNCSYQILFIEAANEAIIHRYKETRRPHPLADGLSIEETVEKERNMLEPVRQRASFIIDTTELSTNALRNTLGKMFGKEKSEKNIFVRVISFGFKYGIPIESDLVFDVRFLPNPFYVEQLRPLSGLDEKVESFVFQHARAEEFMNHLYQMVDFLLPLYVEEGRMTLVISIGCTGGQHRSVAVANRLFQHLSAQGYQTILSNKDLSRS